MLQLKSIDSTHSLTKYNYLFYEFGLMNSFDPEGLKLDLLLA